MKNMKERRKAMKIVQKSVEKLENKDEHQKPIHLAHGEWPNRMKNVKMLKANWGHNKRSF